MPFRIGRRIFLRSAGGAALGLPLLPSLLPHDAAAGGALGPRRFVAITSMSGQFMTDFYPTRTPPGYQTRAQMYGGERSEETTALHETMPGTNHKWAPLSDFAGPGLSNVLGPEFDPFLAKMLLLRGLDYMAGTSHGTGMMLGNYANCAEGGAFEERGLAQIPTIDQVLAYSDAFYPSAPRARSLVLSSGSEDSISDSDYGMGGAVENVPAYVEPLHVWQDLFGDFVEPGKPMEHPNLRLVDSVHSDYTKLRSSSRLSVADKAAIDRHMAFLDDLERELEQGLGEGCTKPMEPEEFGREYPYQEVGNIADYERCVELLVDVAVAALRCDLTRVVTFHGMMAVTDAAGTPTNAYHNSADTPGDWHAFAHEAADNDLSHAHMNALNQWIARKVFLRFLEGLDVEESGGSTYLDNSIVYMGAELSLDHYVIGMPTVLAGGAGGALQTGHYVDYTQLDSDYANSGTQPWGVRIPGLPHNRLLVTILQAMGLTPADYERGGITGYGHPDMFNEPYALTADYYDFGAMGQPLPGIFVG